MKPVPKPVTIRAYLLLLVLVVLLPAVAAALWVIDQTYRAEQQLLQRNLRDTTRALSMVVDRELTQRMLLARVLASSSLLDRGEDTTPEDLAEFEQLARRSLATVGGGWVSLRAADRVLLDTRWPSASAAPQIDPAEPRPLSDAPAIAPLRRSSDGAMHAAVVQPVQSDGRTLLELSVSILPKDLQQIIDQHNLPEDWVASIFDSRGSLVARHPGVGEFAGRPAPAEVLDLLTMQQEGAFDAVLLDGVSSSGYFSTSPQGWTYMTAMPRSDLLQSVPWRVVNVALGALLLLGAAVAAALWVSRRIVDPVCSLKLAAQRLQAGQNVERRATGIVECDEVSEALADAAATVRRSHSELENQVDSAVAQTRAAEQRVSQSRRVEALGRLTGGVAHDFNNLLGIISNSAHLIQRHSDDPELQAPVSATLRAVEVGSRLTQYLMRFAGRQPVRPEVVNLRRYLIEVQELMKIVLGKRIELSLWVEEGLPAIKVDSSELELALINLALNARDALPAGGQVGMHARLADERETQGLGGGPFVAISLTDTGTGVDMHALEHIFEPFFTTKAAGKGTGLGLSQVHGFCKQAGGTALVASTAGMGTTVSLVLPATDEQPGSGVSRAPAVQSSAIAGKRLLLVEDNTDLGDSAAALLESFGCVVQRSSDAAQALRRIEQGQHFDMVLSDVVMPGDLDGLAMARQLRERWPALPIVLISGYSSALAEARDFVVLAKPCAPSQLLAALTRAVAPAPAVT